MKVTSEALGHCIPWCDLFIWTPKEQLCRRVDFDEELWQTAMLFGSNMQQWKHRDAYTHGHGFGFTAGGNFQEKWDAASLHDLYPQLPDTDAIGTSTLTWDGLVLKARKPRLFDHVSRMEFGCEVSGVAQLLLRFVPPSSCRARANTAATAR